MDDGAHHLVRYAKGHALSLEQLQNAHGHALEVGQCLVRGGQRDQLGHILLEKAHHVQLRQTVESGVDRLGGAVTVALSLRLAQRALRQSKGKSNRDRTAEAVNAAFDRLAELNVMRFLKEDMPQLVALAATDEALAHFKSMSMSILELLKREGVAFRVSDEMVGSIIHILYLSVQNAREMACYAEALRELVLGVCDRIVV